MSVHAIDALEPAALWKYFAELSRIPRESRKEKAAGDFVVRVARELGLACERDTALNVLVRKPAAPGYEAAPPVCLQSHLDMVCVKRPGKVHDFARDPITLVQKDGFLMADGTTLGADNGIAVATSLAIMADASLAHGPLELLFTVDEETGLTGAQSLQPGWLQSRTLLNLDSEDEGVLTVGCAGGTDTLGSWTLSTDAARAGSVVLELHVTGLRGGHSGVEIHQGRGNATKMLVRILRELEAVDARLVRIEGGSKRNAIPAEAVARICVPKAKAEEAGAIAARMKDVLRAEIGAVEPGLDVLVSPVKGRSPRVYKRALQRDVLRVLAGLPHGVLKMSAAIPGLVETSQNVAVLTQGPRTLTLATNQRSLVDSGREDAAASTRAILELGGAKATQSNAYPGWKPDMSSRVLATAVRTYRELYGREPKVEAIHAGLECGIIGEKYPGMDMVSMGPTIRDAHSPDERIEIATVGKYWDYLLAILRNLN